MCADHNELWHVWYLDLLRNKKVQVMSFFENEAISFAPCGIILLYYQLINIIYHWACSMWMKGLLRIHLDSVQLCPLCPPINIIISPDTNNIAILSCIPFGEAVNCNSQRVNYGFWSLQIASLLLIKGYVCRPQWTVACLIPRCIEK